MASRGSQQWMYDAWGKPGPYGLETYEFVPGVRITTKAIAKEAFKALGRIFTKHGYKVKQAETGAYNYRKIRGSSKMSNHSWGTALDINWNSNPMTSRLVTDMPPEMVAEAKALKTVDGLPVFRWGGDYKGKKDAMHWELMVTPQELARGVVNVENNNNKSVEKTNNVEDNEVMKKGASGAYVKQVQRLCNGVIARSSANGWTDNDVQTIRVDGVYGDATERAVAHAFGRAQTVLGVAFDGDWSADEVTPAMVALLAQAVTKLGGK